MSYSDKRSMKPGYRNFVLREIENAAPHFHNGVEMLIITKGSVDVTISGEKQTLRAGQACFSDVSEVHSYANCTECEAYYISCDAAYVELFVKEHGGKIFPSFFDMDVEFVAKLYNYYESQSEPRQSIFIGAFSILLDEVYRNSSVKMANRRERKHNMLICNIINFIDKHLTDEISLEVLSEEFGYSTPYISRVLNRYIEEGLKSYVNSLRVERVAEEIENGNAKVLATAYKYGFDSANTFYRAYTKRYGKSPRRNRS